MKEPRIRVMLVDAHQIILSGLQRLIDDEKPDMEVVATATSCEAALEILQSASVDVIVLDVGLAEGDGAAVIPLLIGEWDRRVLMLGSSKGNHHESAILRGACGVVRKEDSPEVLLKAIRKVYEGQLWLDRSATGRLFVELSRNRRLPDPGREKIASLTIREHDVVRTLVTRPSADNKTLATSLHIGEHTLRNHLSRIYDKLGVPNRVELYLFAQRHGVHGQTLN
jgi:two-component system nitrate/nitrite response regulator NarL